MVKAKAAAKAKVLVKKEPGTSAEDKKDLCNFLTQVKGSDQPDKVAVYKHYTSLGRYDKQKKELLALWKSDKSCKWYGSWSKRVTFTENEEAEGRTGFGTRIPGCIWGFCMWCFCLFLLLRSDLMGHLRFQVASLLEMPADSKEFQAVEKSLLAQDGMADDQWDDKDPTQVAFAKAKLKRFHLGKIAVTFGKTTADKTWSESVEANRQTGKASGEQLSSVLDVVGRTGGTSEAGSSSQGAEVKTQEDLRFEKYQNQVAVLSTSKSIFFAFKLGAVERDLQKLTAIAARLRHRKDTALASKAAELRTYHTEQLLYLDDATIFVGAAEEAHKHEIGDAQMEVLQGHLEKMGELAGAVKDKLRRNSALL
ncbi:unnamed protein product [Symbiodinium sp. CCMP2456]|nr:unnamed protein product [Symbiodinium sp. CCMP2456]